MTHKHTPGPWAVVEKTTNYGTKEKLASVQAGAGFVAQRIGEADAHLIAAAPELLAALIECADWLEDEFAGRPQGDSEPFLDRARAAIAKAKGEA